MPKLIPLHSKKIQTRTQMSFPSSSLNSTLCLPPKPLLKFQKASFFCSLHRLSSKIMASEADPADPTCKNKPSSIQSYPTPLSPPLPSISKEIELARAMTASSRSSLFALSRRDILYEDQWLIAVNKPQGVYCESVLESVPRLLADSAMSTDLSGGTKGSPPELHLANRLDRDTSGVMVITKSHRVAAQLVKAFTDHKIKKTYIALCVGSAPIWEKITIKSGHGRSKFGAWRVYAASDVGRTLPGGSLVRDMETSFEVLSINGQGNFRELSEFKKEENIIVVEEKAAKDADVKKDEILVRAYPHSGRTHQIRLHCQYLGISIRGDVKYEGVYEWKGRIYDGHELHAESLSFEHPVTGMIVMFCAPLPSWATQVLPYFNSLVDQPKLLCRGHLVLKMETSAHLEDTNSFSGIAETNCYKNTEA